MCDAGVAMDALREAVAELRRARCKVEAAHAYVQAMGVTPIVCSSGMSRWDFSPGHCGAIFACKETGFREWVPCEECGNILWM